VEILLLKALGDQYRNNSITLLFGFRVGKNLHQSIGLRKEVKGEEMGEL
jgi:hypothetical protein